MSFVLPNNYRNEPIYSTSSISKVLGKNKSNLVGEADWKHPYDTQTHGCQSNGKTFPVGSPWGFCCSYNASRIWNPYKDRHGYNIGLDDLSQLVRDIYGTRNDLYGFVMPQLPDQSHRNNGDGSILFINGGIDSSTLDSLINRGYYYKIAPILLLDAVACCSNQFDANIIWQNLQAEDGDANKYKGIQGNVWMCYNAWKPDSQQNKDNTIYKGNCEWDLESGVYHDSLGNTYTDEDGDTVYKKLICSESPYEKSNLTDPHDPPPCPKSFSAIDSKDKRQYTLDFIPDGQDETKDSNYCLVKGNYDDPCKKPNPPSWCKEPPVNPCFNDPSKCTPGFCQKNPDVWPCPGFCVKYPNDPKCKTPPNPPPGYCWMHPESPLCGGQPNWCSIHPNDPSCQGPNPPNWWDEFFAWLQENGFTLQILEYISIGFLPATFTSVHYDTWKYFLYYTVSAFASPFLYYFIVNTWIANNTDPWIIWLQQEWDDFIIYLHNPWTFWADYWWAITGVVGFGSSILIPWYGFYLGIPSDINMVFLTGGFIATILAELYFAFKYGVFS